MNNASGQRPTHRTAGPRRAGCGRRSPPREGIQRFQGRTLPDLPRWNRRDLARIKTDGLPRVRAPHLIRRREVADHRTRRARLGHHAHEVAHRQACATKRAVQFDETDGYGREKGAASMGWARWGKQHWCWESARRMRSWMGPRLQDSPSATTLRAISAIWRAQLRRMRAYHIRCKGVKGFIIEWCRSDPLHSTLILGNGDNGSSLKGHAILGSADVSPYPYPVLLDGDGGRTRGSGALAAKRAAMAHD